MEDQTRAVDTSHGSSSDSSSRTATPDLARQPTAVVMDDADTREIQRVATAVSRRRSRTIADPLDPALDPSSDTFDVMQWAQKFLGEMKDKGAAHELGVAFRDLDVFGSGSALQLQDSVTSVLTAPLRIGEMFKSGKQQRKQILHGFNGVMRSGELLAVLGRPGSGCSTFLKTICGELYGLELGDKPNAIHYDGISQQRMKKEFRGEVIYNQEVSLPSSLPGFLLTIPGGQALPPSASRPDARVCRLLPNALGSDQRHDPE